MLALKNDNLISGSMDGSIMLWDTNSGKIIRTFMNHSQAVRQLLLLKENEFASASEDKSVIIWDLRNSNIIKILKSKARFSQLQK